MKTLFTLSAAALVSAVALAGPAQGHVGRSFDRPFYMQQVPMPSVDLRPIELQGIKDNMVAQRLGEQSPRHANATTFGAYYGFGDGTYHCSLSWQGGWYGYTYAIAQAYPYSAKFTALLGSSWSMVTPSTTLDLNSFKDDEGNLVMDHGTINGESSSFGLGAYYMPTIKNGSKSYCYGSTTNDNQVVVCSSWAEDYPIGMFDANELDAFYSGVNTGSSTGYAYGSSTAYGPSGETIIDFGQVGGPLVVSDVAMWLTTSGTMFATEDDYITVSLVDMQEVDTLVYTATINAENIQTSSNGSMCGLATFTTEDEDGFESEIAPIVTGHVELYITNTEGCDYGIIMASSDVDDKNKSGKYIYPTSTYWYHDGSAMDEGYYRWQAADATVMIDGHYNALTTYGNKETSCTGFIPANTSYNTDVFGEGTAWAISQLSVTGDTAYNDFDLETTYNYDSFTFEYNEDEVAGIDFDTTYYADYNLVALFVAVKELPEGVTGRVVTVTVKSNDEAVYTINIEQGEGVGIKAINKDVEKEETPVYNLQGVKVSDSLEGLTPGVYVRDGKKVIL